MTSSPRPTALAGRQTGVRTDVPRRPAREEPADTSRRDGSAVTRPDVEDAAA